MNAKFKKAIDDVFAGYIEADALEDIKAEMASALEDRYAEARKRGVIEEAAIKKALSDLENAVKKAESLMGTDPAPNKQKRLEHIARALGLNPLGRQNALLRLVSWLLALCGVLAAIAYWITRHEIAGAVTAMLPFVALSAGGLVFLHLTRYRAYRAPTPVSTAAPASMGAAFLCATLLAIVGRALA